MAVQGGGAFERHDHEHPRLRELRQAIANTRLQRAVVLISVIALVVAVLTAIG